MAAPESGLIWCDPGGSLHRVGNSKSDLRLFAVRMASVTDERNMRDYVYLHPHADHTNAGWRLLKRLKWIKHDSTGEFVPVVALDRDFLCRFNLRPDVCEDPLDLGEFQKLLRGKQRNKKTKALRPYKQWWFAAPFAVREHLGASDAHSRWPPLNI